MAQTPVLIEQASDTVPFLATGDKTAGDVVLAGTVPMIVKRDVDYSENPLGTVSLGIEELWLMPQKAEVISAGDAVYWDATGNPVTGTAGTGAATAVATSVPVGRAAPLQPNGTNATAAVDSYVSVIPNAARLATTIAGAVTATSITGSDSSLDIQGLAGSSSAGGAIAMAGGAADGAGNAGGASTNVGGAGATSAAGTGGAGGSIARTGGAGGTETNAGTGGAGGSAASTGGAGGAVTGAGTGGAGGQAGIFGGVGGATSTTGTGGVGGAISGTGGAGGAATGAGTGGAGGAAAHTAGSGGTAATTGTGGAGGASGHTAGAGGAAGAGGTGGAGGAANLTAGVGGLAATNGTGGAGGAVNVLGAAGGATATGTGGAGSSITITAGAGGTASGAGTSGAGGNVVITAGASAAGGGTAGKQGMVRILSPTSSAVTVTAKTTDATLTIAELLTGFLTGTHAVGGTQTYTLPTGTNMTAGCACGDGEGFEWSLVNLSAAAADTLTVAAGVDHTIVGIALVASVHASTGGAATGYGINSSRWYSRKTTGNTWVTYRIG